MKFNKLVILALLVVPWIAGCAKYDHQFIISRAQVPQIIVLRKTIGQGPVHWINLHAMGQIEGKATLTLILNGKPYKVRQISGNIDFRWSSGWSADKAEIRYDPTGVSTGTVVLRYGFL